MSNDQSYPHTEQGSLSGTIREENTLSSPKKHVSPYLPNNAFQSSIGHLHEYGYSPSTTFDALNTTDYHENTTAEAHSGVATNLDTTTVISTAQGQSKKKRTFTERLKEIQQSSNSQKLLPSDTIDYEPLSEASNKKRKNEGGISGKCDGSTHTFVGRNVLIGPNRRAKCHICKASVELFDLPERAQQPCKGIDIEKELIGYTGSTQLTNKDSIEAHRFTSSDGKQITCMKKNCGVSIYWFEAPWRPAKERQTLKQFR